MQAKQTTCWDGAVMLHSCDIMFVISSALLPSGKALVGQLCHEPWRSAKPVQALLKYFDIRTLEDLLSQQVRNLMHHLLYCFFMT